MSSEHIIIVARNIKTDDIELPLGCMTLYGAGGEQDILKCVRGSYDKDWVLALYSPVGAFYSGKKKN